MKINVVALSLFIIGALAAPAWEHKGDSDTRLEHYKEQGNDLFYCQSGWELVHSSNHEYGLVLEKFHNKRTLGWLLDLIKKTMDKLWNEYEKLKEICDKK
ncbi:hypothetical protein KC352_g16730, partial [Hortaea werneckii]